jgi:hypothetical protein
MKQLLNMAIPAILMFGIISCQDEYNQPDVLVDYNIYTSLYRSALNKQNAGINTFICFSDLSQGYLSHKWTISDGCTFLSRNVTKNDSIFTNFFLPGKESTDKSIIVLFTKGGLQEVRLYNTFPDSVNFRGDVTIPAKKVGDVWVMDTTLVIHVYEQVVPQYKITQNGTEIPSNQDTIYLKADDTLEFHDLTEIGEPDSRLWDVAGKKSSSAIATIQFDKAGVFEGYLTGIRTGSSILNIPSSYVKIKMSSIFKVAP